MNRFLRVGVRAFFKQFADRNFDSKFLVNFADKTLFESFVHFPFAAGKFPQSAEVRVGAALSDEQFAIMKNERGADFDVIINFQFPITNLRFGNARPRQIQN